MTNAQEDPKNISGAWTNSSATTENMNIKDVEKVTFIYPKA